MSSERLWEMNSEFLESMQEEFSLAVQADLENGVKWLNELASEEFANKYPLINKAITKLLDYEV